jgi:hypothetical protein
MVAPATEGIDLFKIANRSISGWVPSFKLSSAAAPVKLPFCSQLEERLLLWLEYHPLVVNYARGDIGSQFAATYRLPIPKHAPFAIGYAFEGKPHDYLPDVVGTLADGTPFIAEEMYSVADGGKGHEHERLERQSGRLLQGQRTAAGGHSNPGTGTERLGPLCHSPGTPSVSRNQNQL